MKGKEHTAAALWDLSREELNKKVADLKQELFQLRFQLATRQLENPTRIREVRRNIARVKTVMHQKDAKMGQGGKV